MDSIPQSSYCSVGTEDLISFLLAISISEEASRLIVTEKNYSVRLQDILKERGFSPSFISSIMRFVQDNLQGLITKKRFDELSKNFSLWAAYQEQETKKDVKEEELLFELPIAEMIAGKTSEEGRFIEYIIAVKKEVAETLKKSRKGNTISMLLTGNEMHVAELLFNHFRSSDEIYPVKWNICLYLVGQVSDEEMAEVIISLPFSSKEKEVIANQLCISLTYVKLLREIWTQGKVVQFMDIVKNIGSKGFSDEKSVLEFCMKNGLNELLEEIRKEVEKKLAGIKSYPSLLEEHLFSAEERLTKYETAYKMASAFYDNAVYELGRDRTIARYGERKDFMKKGVKIYLSQS